MTTTDFTALTLVQNAHTTLSPDGDGQPIFAITLDVYKQFSFFVDVVLTTLVCIIGIAGNSTGLYVLSKDQSPNRNAIHTYLIFLMSVDIIYLTVGLVLSAFYVIEMTDKRIGDVIRTSTLLYRPYIDNLLNYTSTLLLIFMSFERLLALIAPFRSKASVLTRYPGVIICLSVSAMGIFLIPFITSFYVEESFMEGNYTRIVMTLKPEFESLFKVTSFVSNLFLHYLAPCIMLVVNIITLSAFSKYRRQRAHILRSRQNSRRQARITVVIVVVVALYLLLSLPNIFIHTLMLINTEYGYYGKYRLTFLVCVRVGDLLARINASADVFVYILICQQYRVIVGAMCIGSCRRGQRQDGQ